MPFRDAAVSSTDPSKIPENSLYIRQRNYIHLGIDPID
jgi:hypothetical protein